MKNFYVLALLFASVSAFADSYPGCSNGCDAPPMCQSYAKDAENVAFSADVAAQFQLWSVDTVTSNPSPGNYQIEAYGIVGTTAQPGHVIFITYGYEDVQNPTGGCQLAMIDGQSTPVTPIYNVSPE